MRFPKLRFTFGNIIGLLTTAAGIIVNNSAAIAALSPVSGGKIVGAGTIILGVTKAVVTLNHDSIPADKKAAEVGPVVLEKTGPFVSPSA